MIKNPTLDFDKFYIAPFLSGNDETFGKRDTVVIDDGLKANEFIKSQVDAQDSYRRYVAEGKGAVKVDPCECGLPFKVSSEDKILAQRTAVRYGYKPYVFSGPCGEKDYKFKDSFLDPYSVVHAGDSLKLKTKDKININLSVKEMNQLGSKERFGEHKEEAPNDFFRIQAPIILENVGYQDVQEYSGPKPGRQNLLTRNTYQAPHPIVKLS